MKDFCTTKGFVDSVFTEIEVDRLPEFLSSLERHEVHALVVLGPDINSEAPNGRKLLTMHPWALHRAARAIIASDAAVDVQYESAPLVSWISLLDTSLQSSNWGDMWRCYGYRSMLTVKIPIAMGRHFECLFFSKIEEHSTDSAAAIAYETMQEWPRIKHELVGKQQLLTRTEQLVLRLSAHGATSQQAAERCDTSERMVNFHIGNSLRKLNAPNKTAAVLKAIMMGIL
ncbi:hypothetical protein os4_35840 (plasmid) [Comamonadaceae bacterium OS-4]|nr:hypothetical protein os4_35840 [Comamonadaceae bacterium OS-4]